MSFLSLLTMPGLCAYYDEAADTLLLDMHGHLTLATMQQAVAAVLRLAARRSYTRVIITTYHLSSLEQVATHWLRQILAPGLQLLGAQKLVWVCRSSPPCLALAHLLLADLPMPATLLHDLEHAASWLHSYSQSLAEPATHAADARHPRHLTGAFWRRALTLGRPLPCHLAATLFENSGCCSTFSMA